jgi:hypothetical protein
MPGRVPPGSDLPETIATAAAQIRAGQNPS